MTIYGGSDGDVGGSAVPDDLVELLKVVAALRAMPEVAPRPDFVSDLRARLLEDSSEDGARPAGPVVPPQTPVFAGDF